MMRKLSVTAILGLVASILALPALATTGNCETYMNHSGHIPGSYDYAEFYEDGQLVTTVETNGEDVFVNPGGWDAGEDWDQVNKCDYTTTTTLPEETTTTIPEETTTTIVSTTSSTEPEPSSTTSTIPAATSTTAPSTIVSTGWIASATCQTLTAEWGDGIVRIDLYQRLPEGDFGPADGIVPFTESGQEISTVGALRGSEWILIPVTLPGYEAVPDQISLFTEVCEESTTTAPTVTTAPPELPFTGPAGMAGLLIAGLLTVGIGTVLVREFRT